MVHRMKFLLEIILFSLSFSIPTYHSQLRQLSESSGIKLFPLVQSSSVALLFKFPDDHVYSIFCELVEHKQPPPSTAYLEQQLFKHNSTSYSASSQSQLLLQTRELALYDRVYCLVKQNQTFTLLHSPLPLNAVEESPELTLQIDHVTDHSVSLTVTSSMSAFVWCLAYPEDLSTPSVQEFKRTTPTFVQTKEVITLSQLIPNTEYAVYCYGESRLGSPMEVSIQSLKQSFTTQKSHDFVSVIIS